MSKNHSVEGESCLKCGTGYDLETTDEGFVLCVDCLVSEMNP